MKLHVVLSIIAVVSQVAGAQDSQPAATDKPYLLPKENALMRCQVPEFLACIQLDKPACEAAISKAVDEANVEIEAEVQKIGLEQAKTPFFQGKTYGILVRYMQRETNGKFFGCLTKRGTR